MGLFSYTWSRWGKRGGVVVRCRFTWFTAFRLAMGWNTRVCGLSAELCRRQQIFYCFLALKPGINYVRVLSCSLSRFLFQGDQIFLSIDCFRVCYEAVSRLLTFKTAMWSSLSFFAVLVCSPRFLQSARFVRAIAGFLCGIPWVLGMVGA